ncbi:MAG TPA: TolC family protein [Chitinophagaceae bacterium]|nr:TolC family protein [Chitinophagaceae bacterium]
MSRYLKPFLFLLIGVKLSAQEKWDLRKCVDYAVEHNISVKQADLQARFSALSLQQSKLSQYPNLNLSSNVGFSSGRNQDPTSFSLITTGYWSNSYVLQSGVELFNWFSKKNTVAGNQLDLQASHAGVDKAKNDISLNVAVAYLQVLLAREQASLSRIQVSQDQKQLESTRLQVDAGKLPELNAAQLESQLATDSANLVTSEANAAQLLLQLKALLYLDAALPFDIDAPPVDRIPVLSLAELQPETVYALALVNLPQQRVDDLKIKSSQKLVDAARGAMYPSVSLFGSLGTTYNNKAQEAKGKATINPPLGKVTVGGTDYQVYPLQPYDIYTYGSINYFDQLNQNFRQSVGLSISVPLFNNGNARVAWERSKLNLRQWQLTRDQDNQTLKQDIYKAYNDALAAMEKFNANKKAVQTAQVAFDYAQKRYDLGLLSIYELITSQTSLLQAKSNLLYSQYDYVFKMKLLEFYKGQGLQL